MPMTNLNVRIDEDLKKATECVLAELGLNMTTAVNAFARTVVREQGIPFILSLVPNAATRKVLDDAKRNNYQDFIGPFESVEELMRDLNA